MITVKFNWSKIYYQFACQLWYTRQEGPNHEFMSLSLCSTVTCIGEIILLLLGILALKLGTKFFSILTCGNNAVSL